MLLIDKINDNLKDKNIQFSIESATYLKDSQTLCLVLKYSNNKMLSTEIKNSVQNTLENQYGEKIKYQIKYKKNFYDESILIDFLSDKLHNNFPMIQINSDILDINLTNKIINVNLDEIYKNLVEAKLDIEIQQLLKNEFDEDFVVELNYKKENIIKSGTELKQNDFDFIEEKAPNFEIKLDSIEPYIGELISSIILPINLFNKTESSVTICGKIEDLRECKTRAKKDENGKERPEKTYYTFLLKDYSGEIRCVYFPTKANLPKFSKLSNDSEVVMFGDIEDDSFSKGLVFRPKVINLTIIPKDFFTRVFSKPVPKNYSKIFPENYNFTIQADLFSKSNEIKNPYLLENNFVVFDLETTGTNYQYDKIIEIGAVKIERGKLVETFSCLVNPERHIPEDASKVNNIFDDDVKDAYKIEEVMPDFYKFCEGSIMVSYVIDFDFNFIDYNAKTMGYNFTNKTDDAFVMAKQNVKGVKNYKLTTVAKALSVELVNAHRAVYDAIATAEVMIKILEKI